MTNIAEDYVSFETAKLLKEKGFDVPTKYFFNTNGLCCQGENSYNWNDDKDVDDVCEDYSRPSIYVAMKWLRNKHDIVCSVGLFTDLPETPPYWSFNILNQSKANVMYEAFDIKCETYEEASEAAIKYCLENLI